MAHDAHVVVMAGVDLIEPLRPLQILDVESNADLRQLRGDDLSAAARITRRRQLQRHRKTL